MPARSVNETFERMPDPNLLPPCALTLRLGGLLVFGEDSGLCFQSHIDHEPLLAPMAVEEEEEEAEPGPARTGP